MDLKSKSGFIIEINCDFLLIIINKYAIHCTYVLRYVLIFSFSIYPFDLPLKFTDEPSARSKTTIVFGSVTPNEILRAFVDCERTAADKSIAIRKNKINFQIIR